MCFREECAAPVPVSWGEALETILASYFTSCPAISDSSTHRWWSHWTLGSMSPRRQWGILMWEGFQLFTTECEFVINNYYYVKICSLYTHFHKNFIMNGCWILSSVFFLHLSRCAYSFVFYWCGVSHGLICICWTILVNLGWISLGNGLWSFLCVIGFDLLIFCWEF